MQGRITLMLFLHYRKQNGIVENEFLFSHCFWNPSTEGMKGAVELTENTHMEKYTQSILTFCLI